MNDLDTAFIEILSIKSHYDEVARHISNIEMALYDLLKGKLSPSIVSTDNLAQTMVIERQINKKGYTLGLKYIRYNTE